jgi:hypothetical protein
MAVRSGEGRRVGEGRVASSPEVLMSTRRERKKGDEVMKGRGVMGI